MTHVREYRSSTTGAQPAAEAGFSVALARLEQQIARSYAHNSLLYSALEHVAELDTITDFMRWDAAQPSFAVYLQRWLDKAPACVRLELDRHIAIEVEEGHSEMFREMLAHLDSLVPSQTALDDARLEALNYTFSAECASERDFGFFLGGLWATEIMSARRCLQVYRGLRRHHIPDEPLHYFRIHFACDDEHGDEVRDHLIRPVLDHQPALLESIQAGVHDRLHRSSQYLMWYEVTLLPRIDQLAQELS